MSKIVLGKSEGKSVELDINVFLRTHLLIWASTGGGKSWLMRLLAEQMFGKVPTIIIDREGEFSTLREKFGYVLVGPGGETPADVRSAKMLAEKLLELRASAVCDLYELKHETRGEWVKAFLNGLVDAPKRLWGPTAIMVDEAHSFCPEKGQGESVAYGAVADLCGVGRKRGFGIVLATQRLSKLSKNATGEMYNQAAGPTARQADRERAAYEMGLSRRGETEEFSETLRRLECGNFIFQGRAIAMDRVLVMVGAVHTTHAEAGSYKHSAAAPPMPAKIKSLLPKLADLPKAAEEKARTEAELRAEVRRLRAELRSRAAATREVPVADQKAIERAVQQIRATDEKQIQVAMHAQKELLRKGGQFARDLAKLAEAIAKEFGIKPTEVKLTKADLRFVPTWPLPKQKDFPHPRPATTPLRPASSEEDAKLPKGERTVLIAVAQYPDGVERNTITVLTGYKRSSRDAYLLRLAQRGYVSVNGAGPVKPTQEGMDALGADYEPLPTGTALRDYWLARLPEGERKILAYLIEAGGEAVSRDALEEATGYKRSSRDAYILRLAARRLVEGEGRGAIRASAMLFD